MPPLALALLLMAGVLHAGWNLLIKQANVKLIFMWEALLAGTLIFLPVVVISAPIPLRAWPYIVISASVEVVYYLALARGYERGDFSLVYPVARGTAPALLALWAVLFLGDRLTLGGGLGIALIVVGLLIISGGVLLAQRRLVAIQLGGLGIALLTAFTISVYSVIDGAAVRFAPAAAYTVVVIGLSEIIGAPILLRFYGVPAALAEWRRQWQRITLGGVLAVFTYMLVLYVYSFAQVSYAGAIREISIVVAAVVGWLWLREDFGRTRVVGALCMFAGIVLIAVVG